MTRCTNINAPDLIGGLQASQQESSAQVRDATETRNHV